MKKNDSTAAGRLLAVALIVAAVLVAAPPAIPAQPRAASAFSTAAGSNQSPPNLALTPPASTSPQSGSYTFGHAAAQADPPGNPASTGPGPPTSNGKTTIPCPIEWCQKLIERFCHRFDCAKLSAEFRGTASNSSRVYRRVLSKDGAFEPPWNGIGFAVHHIVAQGEARGGVAEFAQSVLKKASVNADDIHNLAALRGFDRQQGRPGYLQLVAYESTHPNAPKLSQRMAHSDTFSKYYYQAVNQRFAQWIRAHGGRYPNKQQVYVILDGIKRDLYSGGKGFIKPGAEPSVVFARIG